MLLPQSWPECRGWGWVGGGQRLSSPGPCSLSDCTPSWEPLSRETGLSLVSSESSFALD